MEKKNTVLLTIIAVATLLVAVVGATFAYFTATGNDSVETSATVKTYTTSTAGMDGGAAINLEIGPDEMLESEGTAAGAEMPIKGTTKYGTSHNYDQPAKVSFTATTDTTADRRFCYKAKIEITNNTVDYLKINPEDPSSEKDTSKPQLVLYVDKLLYTKSYEVTEGSTVPTTPNETKAIYTKLDITGRTEPILLPTTEQTGFYTGTGAENDPGLRHMLEPEAGKALRDEWKIRVAFMNYNINQNANTEKNFTAKVKFNQCDCDTGKDISTPAPQP